MKDVKIVFRYIVNIIRSILCVSLLLIFINVTFTLTLNLIRLNSSDKIPADLLAEYNYLKSVLDKPDRKVVTTTNGVSNFASSAMTVSIDKQDAWCGLLESIYDLVGSKLIITVTKCSKIHSLTVKLCCVDYCEEKEELKLKVLYPIYGKKNKTFNCCKGNPTYKYKSCCSQEYYASGIKYKSKCCNPCIKVCSKIPVTYDYNNYEQPEDTENCIQNYANLTYDDLRNTCYRNVKFYYDNRYKHKPCFVIA